MRRYNIFQAIYMSFYSKDLYRDVVSNWGGMAFLYLLLIVALSCIGAVYQAQVGINFVYLQNSAPIVAQTPVVTIKSGVLSTPENRPYFIRSSDNQIIAIIDTSGKYTELAQAQGGALITAKQMMIPNDNNPNSMKVYTYPATFNAVIDPSTINAHIQDYIGYSWIVLFILFVIGAYIYRVIQSLIYALIGKLICAYVKTSLAYEKLILISLVAITPALILCTILEFCWVFIPHRLLLYFIITLVYLTFGIIANKPSTDVPQK
jgi:hypothetical protein